jgi:hypothetical protein
MKARPAYWESPQGSVADDSLSNLVHSLILQMVSIARCILSRAWRAFVPETMHYTSSTISSITVGTKWPIESRSRSQERQLRSTRGRNGDSQWFARVTCVYENRSSWRDPMDDAGLSLEQTPFSHVMTTMMVTTLP